MNSKKIYGPWIKWHGGECPVPPDTLVEVKLRSGAFAAKRRAGSDWWHHNGGSADIIAYRTVTEQADLDAAEQLLRANDYTVIPPAKPRTFEDVVPMTEAPPKGAEYWIANPFYATGVSFAKWQNDLSDQYALRRRMAYLEKEHALVAARHIFRLKGGEL